jgi:hypothetical protein
MADQETFDYDFEPPKGSGNFFSLEDGKTARVRFQSATYAYQDTFKREGQPDKVSTRYAWIVYNHDEKKAQILKQSGTFFSSLAAVAKDPDYGNPTGYDVKITRTGMGTESKYTITPAKNSVELTKEMLQEIADLDILKDAKESVIMPLSEYRKNGNKFPEGMLTASGDVILSDLPEDVKADATNPLDEL